MLWIGLALVAGFAGGWFCGRKFGATTDQIAKDAGIQK